MHNFDWGLTMHHSISIKQLVDEQQLRPRTATQVQHTMAGQQLQRPHGERGAGVHAHALPCLHERRICDTRPSRIRKEARRPFDHASCVPCLIRALLHLAAVETPKHSAVSRAWSEHHKPRRRQTSCTVHTARSGEVCSRARDSIDHLALRSACFLLWAN